MKQVLADISNDTIVDIIENAPVVLYGAGKFGKIALDNIQKHYPNLQVKFFVDDNRIRNKNDIGGIRVISLQEAMTDLKEEFCIIISNYYVKETLKKIEKAGFNLNKVYYISQLLIENVDKEIVEIFQDDIRHVYETLEDYQSKMIYKTMAESRFTKNIDLLSRTCEQNQYFPSGDFLRYTEKEVFVDAGAFDGDTLEAFQKLTNHHYKYIYAFEPDKFNYEKLVNKKLGSDIIIYNAGLYNKNGNLPFSANKGGSSKVDQEGEEEIQMYRFDDLEIPESNITFVKMDIEGSELKALEGMSGTIQRCKPKLAICIYHKYEDLWELPLFVKKLVPEYKLYIRNYTTYLDEVVLYATI